jgi:putative SOS response-associated peptidase YedK
MCGRFSVAVPKKELAEYFNVEAFNEVFSPRYNAAPTQNLPVLYNPGERTLSLMRWGLIPHWASDPGLGVRMINARSETLEIKPSFKGCLESRRCLVPADGFYEWRKDGSRRVPYRFYMKNRPVFAMAGLWDTWETSVGLNVSSFTIITTKANKLMSFIHDRMPVILSREAESLWLDDNKLSLKERLDLLQPVPDAEILCYPVSTKINSPFYDDPSLVKPVGTSPDFLNSL